MASELAMRARRGKICLKLGACVSDKSVHAAAPQLQVEIGTIKGAPLAFGHHDIGGMGHNLPGEHTPLQVDQHQGRCFRIEFHAVTRKFVLSIAKLPLHIIFAGMRRPVSAARHAPRRPECSPTPAAWCGRG